MKCDRCGDEGIHQVSKPTGPEATMKLLKKGIRGLSVTDVCNDCGRRMLQTGWTLQPSQVET